MDKCCRSLGAAFFCKFGDVAFHPLYSCPGIAPGEVTDPCRSWRYPDLYLCGVAGGIADGGGEPLGYILAPDDRPGQMPFSAAYPDLPGRHFGGTILGGTGIIQFLFSQGGLAGDGHLGVGHLL